VSHRQCGAIATFTPPERAPARVAAALLLAAILLPKALLSATSAAPSSRDPDRCDYEVVAGPGGRELRVEVTLPAAAARAFDIPDDVAPFVDGVAFEKSRGVYRVRLGEAADRRRRDAAGSHRRSLVVPTSSFVFAPRGSPGARRCRFHVTGREGVRFTSGAFPVEGAADTYELEAGDLDEPPLSVFGAIETARVPLSPAAADLAILPGLTGVARDDLLAWVSRAGKAASAYYGRFPVPRVLVIMAPDGPRGVGYGLTFGNGGASILMPLGTGVRPEGLERDWVLTHEMVHLALPNLRRQHHWLEEGIATYVEPIARARVGQLDVEEVWRGLLDGIPKGLPEGGDRGLDRTHTWGRTYWGGALFCLLADVEIRERTQNRKSLDDALRGIQAAGGSIAVRWDLERLLDTGDRAVGLTVLRDLHRRLGSTNEKTDLPALWKRLGVSPTAKGVAFDDKAPLAAVRRSMTAASPTPRP
jgi:hypothetical protein